MELYRQKGVNPFSSFVQLLIQLPILYALYVVFVQSGLPEVNLLYLYSFIHAPAINMHFLGLVDISKASITLSVIAAITQYFQLHYSLAGMKKPETSVAKSATPSMPDFAYTMNKQMKYIFPIMIFFISYKISAVIAVYWAVSNLFTLGQELYVRNRLAKKSAVTV
jgi:YidC/Oxa1 family membrane protein insertase